MSTEPEDSQHHQLLLPAPSETNQQSAHPESQEPKQDFTVNGAPISLDALGPMVVNSDGTLSRIANWTGLTHAEKERTLRVLTARNRVRLAAEVERTRGTGE